VSQLKEMPVPHLLTTFKGPLHAIEQRLLDNQVKIESWFRKKWQQVPPLFYSSVDLRNSGFKLAPVDTNLFPAGFNNLNPQAMPLCIQAVQSFVEKICPTGTQILLIPESHTRHMFYFEHLATLKEILTNAGFEVRIGSLLENLKAAKDIPLPSGKSITLEPLTRKDNRVYVGEDFSPCLILLNNDLSDGVPDVLKGLDQKITPSLDLGWTTRFKSQHFKHYQLAVEEFCKEIDMDPWLISPLFRNCGEVNFMTGEGQDCLIHHADILFKAIKEKYQQHNIDREPFVVIKADAGTYGMAVLMIKSVEELKQLNRKQRMSMATIKGSKAVSQVILQEGVYSFETWGEEESVAEPVVYMIGNHVVGGFYRIHAEKGMDENLNAPGMNFEPLAFVEACNNPCATEGGCDNRFYAYGVIARLALLAGGMELVAL
jgi:glutamate--cysteine ligase